MTRIWSFKECSVETLTQQQKKIFGKDFNKKYINGNGEIHITDPENADICCDVMGI